MPPRLDVTVTVVGFVGADAVRTYVFVFALYVI
jgi:hypothetical protein